MNRFNVEHPVMAQRQTGLRPTSNVERRTIVSRSDAIIRSSEFRVQSSAFTLFLVLAFILSSSAADNFTISGNYNYTLDGATETKSWNIVQTPTNEPFIKLVTTLTTNGAVVNIGTVTSPGYLWAKILSTNTAYFLRVGVIENSTTNFMDKLYGNSSGGDFKIGPIASTNLFVIPNTNGVKFEHALFSR